MLKLPDWPPDGATYVNLAARWRHLNELQIQPHCHILPRIALLTLGVSIELVFSSARVTAVKCQLGVSVSQSLNQLVSVRHLDP